MQDALNTSSSWGSEEWIKALDAYDALPEVDMEMLADKVTSGRPAENWHGSSSFCLRGLSADEAEDCTVDINQARFSCGMSPAIHAFAACFCSKHHPAT